MWFFLLVIYHIHDRNTNGMKRIIIFWHAFVVNKIISDFITDEHADKT